MEWQCAVTLSGDVRVEFWDSDRFSDVSAQEYNSSMKLKFCIPFSVNFYI